MATSTRYKKQTELHSRPGVTTAGNKKQNFIENVVELY